jgi:hypothetical protein
VEVGQERVDAAELEPRRDEELRAAGVKGNADSLNPAMSADGSLVAFYSGATNLDPADTDPILDVYVKET